MTVRFALVALIGLAGALGAEPAMAAPGANGPRIVDVRVGRHSSYDRVVIELSGPAAAHQQLVGQELLLELAAKPVLARQTLQTGLDRVPNLRLLAVDSGAEVRFDAPHGRVRAFVLTRPDRIVVDFAAAGPGPFKLAADLEPVPGGPAGRGRPTPPTPEPPRVIVPEPPAPEPPSREASGTPEPPPIPEAPETPTLGETPPVPPVEPDPTGSAGSTPPAEVAGTQPTPPAPTPVPVPTPAPSAKTGGWFDWLTGVNRLGIALVLAIPFIVVATVIWLVGRRNAQRAEYAELLGSDVRSAELISGDELVDATERIDLLEKRIDEEVRKRVQLESRAGRLQEDLKVVHDRVQRLARRGDAAS